MINIESTGYSTRIEGSKLSDSDVAELLDKIEIQRFDSRDAQEVAGYAEVMDVVAQSWEDTLHRVHLHPSRISCPSEQTNGHTIGDDA